MLPIELARSEKTIADDVSHIILDLRIDRELFWFNGHFARQPILPGVAQLDWVMHYGTELLVPSGCFSAIDSVKFQQPVLPGQHLRLTLIWNEAKQLLTFTYHIIGGDEERIASSGKIRLVVTPCQ